MKNITLPYLSLRSGVVPGLSDASGAVLYYDVALGKVMASLGGNDYVVFGEGGSGSGGALGSDTVGSLELKNGAVENVNFRNSLGLSIVGRSVNSAGIISDIVAGVDGDVLYRNGTSLTFGKISIGSVTGLSLDLSGKVVGPVSSTNNAITLFDGVSGKLVKNSLVTIDGTGVIFASKLTGLSSPAAGSDAANKTYVDGLLGLSSSTPSPIGIAGPGSGVVGSRFDHVHAHGDQTGGTLHALASVSAAGFMSASDFTKLSGMVAVSDGDKGDVVVSGGGTAWTVDLLAISTGKIADNAVTTLKINDGAVTNSKIRTSAALSIVGRSAGTSGTVGDIVAATDGDILRVSSGVLGFGAIPQSSVAGLSASLTEKVDGLVSSTDNVVLRFDGTGGKTIQSSAISISDSGVISGAAVPLIGTDVANKDYVDSVVGAVPDGDKGDISISGGVWSIDANVVTDLKLRDSAAVSVIGRSTGTSGDPADIVAVSDGAILRRAAGALGFGTIPQSSVDNLTTDLAAKIPGLGSSVDNVVLRFDGTTGKVIQSSAISISDTGVISGAGTPLVGTDVANKTYVDTAISGGSIPDGDKGDVVVSSSGTVWTIDAGIVSDSKLRTSAGLSVIGRNTNTTGSVGDITSTTDGHVLRQSGTSIGFGLIPEGSVTGLSTKLSDGDKGDITTSASFATWTIDANAITTGKIADSAVTLAKIENLPNNSLIGRYTLGTGIAQNITLGSFLTLSGLGVLSNAAITGDVAIATNSTTSTIGSNVVSDAKFRTSAGLSVVGRSVNTTGNVADIVGTDGQVLRVSGTTLGFGAIATAGIGNSAVTHAKIQSSNPLSVLGRASNTLGNVSDITGTIDGQVLMVSGTSLAFATVGATNISNNTVSLNKIVQISTDSLLGRDTAGTGDVEVIGVGSSLLMTGSSILERAAISGDITIAAGSNTSTITNSSVTNAKLANIATSTIKGRVTASTGVVEDLSAAQVKTILNIGDVVNNLTTTSSIDMLSATQGKLLQDTKQKIISSGTAAPSGGTDGDIYIQYS